jgi:hypothetical protein
MLSRLMKHKEQAPHQVTALNDESIVVTRHIRRPSGSFVGGVELGEAQRRLDARYL